MSDIRQRFADELRRVADDNLLGNAGPLRAAARDVEELPAGDQRLALLDALQGDDFSVFIPFSEAAGIAMIDRFGAGPNDPATLAALLDGLIALEHREHTDDLIERLTGQEGD